MPRSAELVRVLRCACLLFPLAAGCSSSEPEPPAGSGESTSSSAAHSGSSGSAPQGEQTTPDTGSGTGSDATAANAPSMPVLPAPGAGSPSDGSSSSAKTPSVITPADEERLAPAERILPATPEEIAAAQEAFDQLVLAQQDENPDQWTMAEQQLNRSPAAAVPVLTKALEHKDSRIRELAASLLVQTAGQDDRTNRALLAALKDPSPYVQANAAAALSYLTEHSDEVIPLLIRLLDHDDALIRMTATVGLGNAGAEAGPAVARLTEFIQKEDVAGDVQRSAVVTLGRIGTPARAALPALRQLAETARESSDSSALLTLLEDSIRQIEAPAPAESPSTGPVLPAAATSPAEESDER